MDFNNYVSFMNSELNVLKGVGEKKSALFAKLGINCVWDLLYYFPSSYEDRTTFCKVSVLSNKNKVVLLPSPPCNGNITC